MRRSGTEGLVTVIIPSRNRAHYLQDALRSLERQTYRPVQVVVVDDGSTDETRHVVSEWETFELHDNGFSVDYIRQEEAGACAARNRGIDLAEGEFLHFLDSDDVLYPQALAWAVDRLRQASLDFVYFSVHSSDENLVPFRGIYLGAEPRGTSADICAYLWHTMGAFYRREVIERVGLWNESLAACQDWEYAARIKLLGFCGDRDPRVVGLFRDHRLERIGVRSFNRRYVLSVEQACHSIEDHARELNKLDLSVRLALARRLFIHAIELGANGFPHDEKRLLTRAWELSAGGGLQRPLIHLFSCGRSRLFSSALHRMARIRQDAVELRKRKRGSFGAPLKHLRGWGGAAGIPVVRTRG